MGLEKSASQVTALQTIQGEISFDYKLFLKKKKKGTLNFINLSVWYYDQLNVD